MKLRMDGFWNTFTIVAAATVVINILVQLILNGFVSPGESFGVAIMLGAVTGGLVKFKKLSFS